MKRILNIAIIVACALLSNVKAQIILDFEDRAGIEPFGNPIPADYHGVNFSADFGTYSWAQPPFNPHSGTTRALTNALDGGGYNEVSFSFSSGPAVFDGAWFAGAYPVYFNLYSGSSLVSTSETLNCNDVPTFLSSGYSGEVTSVGIVGTRGEYVFDDLTYETSAQVPDVASTAGLLGLALLGLAGIRRRLQA